MSGFDEIRSITRHRTVLFVDDDPYLCEAFRRILSLYFSRVLMAADGGEGFDIFSREKVDLVITDQIMPVMSGLEMVREIRKKASDIPVILLTGGMDAGVLADAINQGVNQFIPKPVEVKNLLAAIANSLQKVILEEQKDNARKIDIMKEKEKLRNLQEKLSFNKQLGVIRNDLYYRTMRTSGTADGSEEWFINARFRPYDILSGDSYSIRRIDKSTIFAFIIDAMGKGVEASGSATHATAVINHLVDRAKEENYFSLKQTVNDFLSFIVQDLLADEMISMSFVCLDFSKKILEAALFSMPPIYMQTVDGGLISIESNNMPIMNFTGDFRIDNHEIRDVNKILFSSDGLIVKDYLDYIRADFLSSAFKVTFDRKFQERIKEVTDDITYVMLKRIDSGPEWERTFTANSCLEDIMRMSQEVEGCLTEKGFEWGFIIEMMNAFSEVIMNAYEHGALNVDAMTKRKHVLHGDYEEYLTEREKSFLSHIDVSLAFYREMTESYLLMRVSDQGSGFDPVIIREVLRNPELVHGKGIKMVKHLVDEIHFNDKGNDVILIKTA